MHPVIALITEWQNQAGHIERRDEHSDLGGTMRLGEQSCNLAEGSLVHGCTVAAPLPSVTATATNSTTVIWMPCRMPVCASPASPATATSLRSSRCPRHPWFIGCQFHPEFTSTPRVGQPLFVGLVKGWYGVRPRPAP